MRKKKYGYAPFLLVLKWFVVILLLCFISFRNYLLFHSLVEIFAILVACCIFMIAWHSRDMMEEGYLMFLGVAYLFIGGMDLLHTLSYKGMGVLNSEGGNVSTQLWISARCLEGLSLFFAPLFINKKVEQTHVFAIYTVIFTLIAASIFYWKIFPDCFIPGQGLTLFKKWCEYFISVSLLVSLFFLGRIKDKFDLGVLRLMVGSIVVTIASELAFTLYISVYGFSNFIGHILKLISFVLIYKAIVKTGIEKPYNLLFISLKKREKELQHERDELKEAMTHIRTLKSMLPICSKCKKIRDDQGYWKQIETYISEHTDTTFTHSLCLECSRELYPDFFNEDEDEDEIKGSVVG